MTPRPPKDDLVRASHDGHALRAAEENTPPTLFGHFTPFNTWTTIDSVREGKFLERVAPGAFAKTITENLRDIKVLFQHGQDPQIGDKPLGGISVLREEEIGPYYEVPLLDAGYVRNEIQPGLEAGLYGASFRFQVLREDYDEKPTRGDHNPDRLPERTVKEVRLFEFGPVTFPAYATATAGVRSMTDEYLIDLYRSKPERLRELLQAPAPSVDAAPLGTSKERRGTSVKPRFRSIEEFQLWLTSQVSLS